MTFDLYILDKVGGSIIEGIEKGISPLLLKVPLLILIGVGLLLGWGLGVKMVKWRITKIYLVLGLLITLVLLFLRGG